MAYNYEAAFVAYCRGGSLEEIGMNLGIPSDLLRDRQRQMGWKRMVPEIIGQLKVLDTIQTSAELIETNRKYSLAEVKPLEILLHRHLEVFDRWWNELTVLEEIVPAKLRDVEAAETDYQDNPTADATQAKERAVASYHSAVFERNQCRKAACPGPKALAELANAVAAMQDIRYRALGDLPNAKAGQDAKPVSAIKQQIIINLPGAIGKPRSAQAAQVFEAQTITEKSEPTST